MNERIKQLADQAWIYQMTVYEDNGVRTFGEREQVFSKEKFAELIVRECAKFLDENSGSDQCNNVWCPTPEELLQHFGVEE